MSLAVELVGGAPWGFRLGGGADFGIPLEIAKIRKRSKADFAGLQEGDIVTNIENHDVSKKSHGEAMTIIEAAGSILRLCVSRSAASFQTGPGISVPINKPVTLVVDSLDTGSSSRGRGSVTGIPIGIQHYHSAPTAHAPVPAAAAAAAATVSTTPMPLIVSTSLLPRSPGKVHQTSSQQFVGGWKMETQQSSSQRTSNDGDRKVTIISQSSTVQSGPYSSTAASAPPASTAYRAAQPLPQVRPFVPASASLVQTPARAPAAHNGGSSVEPWTIELTSYSLPVSSYKASIIKSPAFNIKKHDVKRVVWSPTVSVGSTSGDRYQTTYYQQEASTHHQSEVVPSQRAWRASSQPPPDTPMLDSFDGNYGQRRQEQQQQQPSYYIPAPPPLEGLLTQSQAAPAKKRIPGMVNPLITEHGSNQGSVDGMLNRSRRTDEDDNGESATSERKKKVYSDSSFYDAPGMDYPTVDEQVEMCKKIAVLLHSDRNSESRGGRMFAKRKQTADQWATETSAAPKQDAVGASRSYGGDLDLESLPLFQFRNPAFGYNQVRHHPEPIKSHLSAEEVERLKASERNIVKHDSLPPSLAFDVTSALTHSSGKGAKIFAKRRERADKYVVDESNARKASPALPEPGSASAVATRLVVQKLAPGKAAMTPWEAALEGDVDKAFEHLSAYKKFEVLEVPVNSALARPPPPPPPSRPPAAGPPLQGGADASQAGGGGAAGSKLRIQYKPFQPVAPPGAPPSSASGRVGSASQSHQIAAGGAELPFAAATYQPSPYAYRGSTDWTDRSAGGQRAKSEPRATAAADSYVIGYPSYSAAAPRPLGRSYNALPRGFATVSSTSAAGGFTASAAAFGGAWSTGPPKVPASAGVSVF